MDKIKIHKNLRQYDRIVYYIIIIALVGSLAGYFLYQFSKDSVEKYSVFLDIGSYAGILIMVMVIIYTINYYMKSDKTMKMKQQEELEKEFHPDNQ
ncbi:MAG: hypothetical protein K1X92_00945 [Bacteroidia bacterium]|nr:hypothetical protein [Bacteroidia bacterium]